MQSEAVSTACPLDTSSNHKKQCLQTIADFFEDIVQTKFKLNVYIQEKIIFS